MSLFVMLWSPFLIESMMTAKVQPTLIAIGITPSPPCPCSRPAVAMPCEIAQMIHVKMCGFVRLNQTSLRYGMKAIIPITEEMIAKSSLMFIGRV